MDTPQSVLDAAATALGHARALAAAGNPAAALNVAVDADRLVTPYADELPALREATLAAAVTYAAAAGEDEACATLAAYLTTQALNAGDLAHAVAGKTLEAEAQLRQGHDDDALEAARIAAAQATRLDGDARGWLPRAAEIHAEAARRTGRFLEAREAMGLAIAEGPTPLPERLRLLSARVALAFDGPGPELATDLAALAASPDPDIALGAALADAERAAQAGDLDHADAALARASRLGAPAPTVAALHLGLLLARGAHEAALPAAEALAAASPGPRTTRLLADALLAADRPLEALAALDRALDQAITAGSTLGQLRARYARAALGLHLGDVDGSRADARAGLELATALAAPTEIATGHALVARALLATEQVDDAMAELTEAVAALARLGAPHRAAEVGLLQAFARRTWPEAPPLPADVQDAVARATTSTDLRLAALAHLALAPAAFEAGDADAARDHLGRALALDARAELGLGETLATLAGALGVDLGSA